MRVEALRPGLLKAINHMSPFRLLPPWRIAGDRGAFADRLDV
jgi:hypothetical protein